MVKLFEIPIYALSEKRLSTRYRKYVEKLKEGLPSVSEDIFIKIIETQTFPQRIWKHNHKIGYIDILFDRQDIVYEIYLPYPKIEKYHWNSQRKLCFYNIMANGTHFYVDKTMNNTQIAKSISKMLDSIVKDHLSKSYYVDRSAFDTLHKHIDYINIFELLHE